MFLANDARIVEMNSIGRRVHGRPLDLIRSLSVAGKHVFTADDARKYLAEDAALWLALRRLQKAGWIKRLKRALDRYVAAMKRVGENRGSAW